MEATYYPTAAELSTVSNYCRTRGMSLVPTNIFRRSVTFSIFKAVRPPTKKHLGTRLRQIEPLPCVMSVFDELTSTTRGLVVESPSEGIERRALPGLPQQKEGRPLQPMKVT
jgi:hypothetical protein